MSQQPLVRSTSRSKRSTTNLANLRLAPLSAKYTEQPQDRHAPKSPYEEAAEATLAKYTYRQGRSAPSTPGLSPGRHWHSHGGLSRRESLYDDDDDLRQYSQFKLSRPENGFGEPIEKSLSEAAGKGQYLSSQGVPLQKMKKGHKRSRTVGTNTPRSKSKSRADDDWLSHAGATANALLLESKGATWLQSRPSSTNLVIADDDDDDEQYEEMAALSATVTRISDHDADGQKTPRQDRWGSRFGSRPASRHASRRGSMAAGTRTPTAALSNGVRDYFEQQQSSGAFIGESSEDDTEDDDNDEKLTDLTKDRSFGLGPYVDKLMFSILNLPDAEESGTETGNESETAAEAKARRMREAVRRQQEKEKLVAPPAPEAGQGADKVGIWQDAGWLLSVASRAFG